jgi:hypothetical protein
MLENNCVHQVLQGYIESSKAVVLELSIVDVHRSNRSCTQSTMDLYTYTGEETSSRTENILLKDYMIENRKKNVLLRDGGQG